VKRAATEGRPYSCACHTFKPYHSLYGVPSVEVSEEAL